MKRKFAKNTLKKLTQAIAKATLGFDYVEANRNVDIYINSLLRDFPGKDDLNDPEFLVRQLRASFMPYRIKVVQVKGTEDSVDENSARFSRLIETLASAVPCLPAPLACEMAATADNYLGNTQYIQYPGDPGIFGEKPWATDVAWAVAKGSSFAKRGRFLYTAVRFMRPSSCIEAGTYFGMSALFILSALTRYADQGHLHTIEASEPIYSVSSDVLKRRFGAMVTCHCGLTQDRLPEVLSAIGTIDFFYHDNGHARDVYIRDFHSVLESMRSGGVIIYDDIYYGEGDDPPLRCHEGWMEIVSHPRVKRAVEINSEMGLMLLS